MRILLIAPTLPHPPAWGFAVRVRQLLVGMAARHDVTLLAYASPEDVAKVEALSACGASVRTVALSRSPAAPRRFSQLAHAVTAHSFHLAQYRSHEMQAAIDSLLAGRSTDVIQIESSVMSRFDFHGVPVIVDEHNIESELVGRSARADGSHLRRVFKLAEYRKVRAEEEAAWRRSRGCAVVSCREADIVRRRAGNMHVAVVPNGVDPDRLRPGGCDPDSNLILFTGLLTYAPNADAVSHFAKHVFPIIRAARPEARFVVAGWGARRLQHLAGAGVEFTGLVDDLRPLFDAAGVVVAPIRFGSGTRLKILEAMAMGKAIVSTSVGCEGIDVQSGHHLLVADEPEDFAASVIRLLDDSRLAAELGANARAAAVESYSWKSSVEKLDQLYRCALDVEADPRHGAA